MSITLIIVVILIVVGGWIAVIFNGLVALRNRAKEAWSDIDIQLKRRYDLIPNLVETVKGYAAHESGVFQKVTEARTRAMGAGSLKDKAQFTKRLKFPKTVIKLPAKVKLIATNMMLRNLLYCVRTIRHPPMERIAGRKELIHG